MTAEVAGGIGSSPHRFEDLRFVTGRGRYVDDLGQPDDVVAEVLRSPYAHGRIVRLDVGAARRLPGVLAVLTGADAVADGLGGIPWEVCPPGRQAAVPGDPAVAPPQPLLAVDQVRYVGEPVALVLARSRAAALDAVEAIELEVLERPAVIDAAEALGDAAPRLWDDFANNVLFRHEVGAADAAAAAVREAAIVVELETHVPRLAAVPMEPRAYRGTFDAASGRYTLEASAGKPNPVRDTLAQHVLHLDPQALRVIAPDIGGGFGAKNVVHAESALVLWAARRVGRAVRWTASRSAAFQSDMQGRDHRIRARLALDATGRFLALAFENVVNLGAYLAPRAVIPCLSGTKVLTGPYRIEVAGARVTAVFTNTVPTCPYRGAGVPETAFVVERLVDLAARRLDLDPAELRRRNLLQATDLPWTTPTGTRLHSTDFRGVLEATVRTTDWAARRTQSRDLPNGRRRGVGMAYTIEAYGAAFDEAAEVSLGADGRLVIAIGTKSGGQSHETAYAQIVASALGIDPTRVDLIQGDTDRVLRGNGTGASRSITTGGSALWLACKALLDAARPEAARLLQCGVDQLDFTTGRFLDRTHPGGPSIDLATIAAAQPNERLAASATFRPDGFNVPGGCHVAEVEVDVETGRVQLVAYRAVHDAGRMVNPMVVEGQLAGGIVQGVGASLMEQVRFEPGTGQLITGALVDYAVPRASDVPSFALALQGQACASNPLGAKAVGEAGPVAAPPAVINAVVDALAAFGVTHVDLPATPERVWAAIRAAESRSDGERRASPSAS